jgi:hypothetical protein
VGEKAVGEERKFLKAYAVLMSVFVAYPESVMFTLWRTSLLLGRSALKTPNLHAFAEQGLNVSELRLPSVSKSARTSSVIWSLGP